MTCFVLMSDHATLTNHRMKADGGSAAEGTVRDLFELVR